MTVTESALNISPESTSIWLQEDEVLTVDDGLYALMIASANDSANVLAEHVAGTQEEFVEMMNQRCQEIGAVNTNFENTHGLTSANHLTTAYDMALIAIEAYQNEILREHFGITNHAISQTNKTASKRQLTNHHSMLNRKRNEYDPDVVAGKTGYTHAAGNTLVTVAERDGRTLVAVVMNASNLFGDTSKLLNYGFEKFHSESVSTEEIETPTFPLLDENQEQIGETKVVIPEEVEVILPNSISAENVSIDVEYPEEIREDSDKPVLKITTLGVDNTVSEPIREIPLEYEFQFYAPEPTEKERASTEIYDKAVLYNEGVIANNLDALQKLKFELSVLDKALFAITLLFVAAVVVLIYPTVKLYLKKPQG